MQMIIEDMKSQTRNDDGRPVAKIASMMTDDELLRRFHNERPDRRQTIGPRFAGQSQPTSSAVDVTQGVFNMRRSDNTSAMAPAQAAAVPDIGAAWIPRRKATLITYEKGAIELRDRPTGRLIAWHEPGLSIAELPDLVALFSSPPDAWFAPRIRGIIMEAEYAILRGRTTPRDMYKALGQMLGRPERAWEIFFANPILARTLTLQEIYTGTPINKRALVLARKAFKPGRGPRPKETREFFLDEVKHIAVEYGMDLRLPQHRDESDGGVTPFFSFARAMVDIVIAHVLERHPNIDRDEVRRRRLAPFRLSRIALIDALERTHAVKTEGSKDRGGDSFTKTEPWRAEGISRRTWYRQKKQRGTARVKTP